MNTPPQAPARDGWVTLTHVMYALHGLSALTGILTPAFVVTAFLTGWPSLIAILLNYLKRDRVRGTWLESHFIWQWRTFWFALLWLGIALLMALTFVGIPAALALVVITGLWVIYRIVRGWLRLGEGEAMPLG